MSDSKATIQIAPGVLYQALSDEAVLLNLNNDHYYGLDDVGTRMWQLLSEHGNVETTVEKMLAEYEVDEATVRRDLGELIAKMEQAGLISRVEG